MKITIFCFSILLILIYSCDIQLGPTFNPKEDKLPKPVKNQDMGFKELKKNLLYIDLKKNIYIKFGQKIKLEDENKKVIDYRYFNLMGYHDTILPLQKIVDVKSFHQIDSFRYEDKNHYYLYDYNSKNPPVFRCEEKQNIP